MPAQAGFGFASVSSLWREKKFEDETGRDERQDWKQKAASDVSDRAGKSAKSEKVDTTRDSVAGKLKKPKKATRSDAEAATDRKGQVTFELQDPVRVDAAQHAEKAPAKAKAKPPKTGMPPPKEPSESRRPSIDLSEYAFGVYNLGMQTQAPADALAAKKTLKKAAPSRQTKDEATAVRKPRKGKAKSEAVILNSDYSGKDDSRDSNQQTKSAGLRNAKESRLRKKKGSTAKPAANQTPDSVTEIARHGKSEAASLTWEAAPEKSLYFAPSHIVDPTNAEESPKNPAEDARPAPNREQSLGESERTAGTAPHRRKEWTPVKDTSAPEQTAATAPSTHRSPKLQFADLLRDFGYKNSTTSVPPAKRAASGESLTKRRRIEVASEGSRSLVTRELQKENDPGEPKEKKTKPAGRKKLPTITALATSAYQPELEQPAEQSTVSEFFVPRKEKDPPPKEAAPAPEKPKKPRKPRKKKNDTTNADQTTAAPAKKSKTAKVKFGETDYLTKLHSPARATSQMMQQDFLFGTSSQLAVDESPAFIRDMQAAVQASEMDASGPPRDQCSYQINSSSVMPSQPITTPRRSKSCAEVPTAPHGTCLSLQQAHRELWCVSSRDDDGGFLQDSSEGAQGEDSQMMNEVNDAVTVDQPDATRKLEQLEAPEQPIQQEDIPETTAGGQSTTGSSREAISEPAGNGSITVSANEHRRCDNDIVHLSHSSPVAPSENAEDSAIAFDESLKDAEFSKENAPLEQPETGIDSHHIQNDDSWMLISSDGPEPGTKPPSPSRFEHWRPSVSDSHHPVAASTMRRRPPLSSRDILQPLDANASLHSPAALSATPVDHARAFTTFASHKIPKSPTGRPRGRPRKEASAPSATAPSPKKRGRPPKHPVVASDPSPETAKFKRPKAAVSASQPPQSPSGWLDVDEISDSDSPVTPSPPRRRASASPHATPPLDITVDGSPLTELAEKGPAIVSATSTFKPGEPQWPAIRDQVFTQISSTIKDAPRGADPSKPSWYQKILMYDPITLEELTGWLNQQGLRINIRKQKPKPKKRGRKKRDTDGNVLEEESNAEWEVHEEQLQAWMVQKWCEEKSICCVWAGGGWGGRAKH